MRKAVKARKLMTTLGQIWSGERCPHEDRCLCRKGSWCPEAKLRRDEQDYLMVHLAGCSFAYDRCCCQVLREIENLAGEYLRQAGVHKPPVPLDVINLFDSQRSIEIRYLPLKRYLGCTWFLDKEWVVHINETVHPEARHFTAFHEGFHIICGSVGLAFRKADDARAVVRERLADYFAASILMPRELVRQRWPKVRDADAMADIFSVPHKEMRDWLKRLGLEAPATAPH